MTDQTRSNLEPIDDSDLNLKEKFLGGATSSPESEKQTADDANKNEQIFIPEKGLEGKEGAVEKEASYSKILSKIPAPLPSSSDDTVVSDAMAVNQEMDEESKIKNLVNLAEMKGIPHAVKVAKHYEDNYLLDEFHDRLLADELHDALVKKGLIKEI